MTALTARDPGLQAERTALSWHRTALSALVTAVLVLRGSLTGRASLAGAAGVCLAAAALAAARHRPPALACTTSLAGLLLALDAV